MQAPGPPAPLWPQAQDAWGTEQDGHHTRLQNLISYLGSAGLSTAAGLWVEPSGGRRALGSHRCLTFSLPLAVVLDKALNMPVGPQSFH
jgi:hypothetical protein